MPSNDNDLDDPSRSPLTTDAHGAAALLLVESLIHGLIERSLLTSVDAIEIIEGAVEIQGLFAEAADGAGVTLWQAQELLQRMSTSLSLDVGGTPNPAQ